MMPWLILGGIATLFVGGVVNNWFNIQLIPDFYLFGFRMNWVTALAMLGLVFVLVRYGAKHKAVIAVAAFICVLALSFHAVTDLLNVRADMARQSATHGRITHVNMYEEFTAFDIRLTDIVFYKVGNEYVFTREFNTTYQFNGTVNKYNLLVNDRPAARTVSNAGNLVGFHELGFFDLNGGQICIVPLEIRFTFSVSRITVRISSTVSDENFGYLRQYVEINGIHLRLIEEQFNPGGT